MQPRYDQIAELTRGVELPLDAIDPAYLRIIAEGLASAFDAIRSNWPDSIRSGSEAEVTALLEARLNQMLDFDPFWRQLVVFVARGKESVSFDGSHLEKRPDLSIVLTGRNRNFPLVAESKVIDAKSAKTEKMYCDNGLRRFIEGEYAWACREALMIAYVRDGSLIKDKLLPLLSSSTESGASRYSLENESLPLESDADERAFSMHARAFKYCVQSSSDGPGSIRILHLWLPVSSG